MAEGQAEATPEEFKAMANPLRLRILRLCLHESMTNKELAERLRKDPATTLHHVRMLVKTGFLRAEPVRTGRKGALERPYRATGKSWTLRAPRPEDEPRGLLAGLDAFRAESLDAAEADVNNIREGARMGLKLNKKSAKQLSARIRRLIQDYYERGEDPDGDPYGLYIGFHKRP